MRIMTNGDFIAKYPWLKAWDEVDEIEYCYLDDLPPGWRAAYGEQFAAALARAIELDSMKDTYHIDQVKIKFGAFCWYDNAGWRAREVKEYYEKVFAQTCVKCGKPAHWRSKGSLEPYCDECKEELARNGIEFIYMQTL